MQANLPGIIEHVLGLRIISSEELKDDIQYTKERKTDLLKKVKDAQGQKYILHIEYQKKNERIMVYRMAEYSIMLQRKYKLPVKQFVIYIGQDDFKMSTTIQTLDFQYRIEQKLLAILGNPGIEDPKQILKQIVMDIKNQTTEDQLDEIMVSVNEFFNIEKDPIYIRGEKKGFHKKALGIALELKKK
eukprot:gene12055-14742_t